MKFLARPQTLIASLLFFALMFFVTMRIANPAIDGGTGADLLKLQLAFDKQLGSEIIAGWGAEGVTNFKRWIVTDYLYAVAYSLFFASLICFLAERTHGFTPWDRRVVQAAFAAGFCDWLENSLELGFILDPTGFPAALFFFHSLIAGLKWLFLSLVFFTILRLLVKGILPE